VTSRAEEDPGIADSDGDVVVGNDEGGMIGRVAVVISTSFVRERKKERESERERESYKYDFKSLAERLSFSKVNFFFFYYNFFLVLKNILLRQGKRSYYEYRVGYRGFPRWLRGKKFTTASEERDT